MGHNGHDGERNEKVKGRSSGYLNSFRARITQKSEKYGMMLNACIEPQFPTSSRLKHVETCCML